MQANMGTADRVIRIIAAIAIGILYFTKMISGTATMILLAIAGILVITSFIGFCPLYYPFKLKSNKK